MSIILKQDKLQHINSITHEGKVIVVATDSNGKIFYTIKQDGFEDSYLNTPPDQRTGWENWQTLELPNEPNDQSVLDREKAELTYQQDTSKYILRSRYQTHTESAVAPVQLISALGHLYVFRQSKSNTLLVDRFILDGMTNKLNRKLEVRFKRSKQRYTPTKNMKKTDKGLNNIDSLDFRDANGNFFYEPTTELNTINNLQKGWFSVVFVPTIENDVYRWHIFAYNSQTQKVELTTIRASSDGLFDVKDYTVFEESNETLVPRSIQGVIKRSLEINNVTITNGLAATKYDLQQAQQTQSGEEQLLKTSTRLMLAIPTDKGTAAFSFGIAGDGTLAQIDETPENTLLRSQKREILLPLNTLDEIKSFGDKTPPPQGIINGLSVGEEDVEDLVTITTDNKAAELANGDLIKITNTQDYQGLYQTKCVDENTFDIDLSLGEGLGYWEKIEEEEGGLIFDNMITAYEKTPDGKLRITCPNHGLEQGDQIQIIGTESYNDSYPVQKIDDTHFAIEQKWSSAEMLNIKLLSQKRRGIVFDGVDDYLEIPQLAELNPKLFTVSCWMKVTGGQGHRSPITSRSNNGGLKGYFIYVNPENKLEFSVGNGESWQSVISSAIALDTWIHISGSYDGETLTLYINGVQAGSIKTAYVPNTIHPLRIGAGVTEGAPQYFFPGQIADVRVWKIARSAEDIKSDMHLQLTGKEIGLVGYWKLGAISEGKVIDFSTNGNDATVCGDVYVSAATLNRKLNSGLDAVKYSNPELFAVSERATYEESFEFKVNGLASVDLNSLDNADGKGNKIFTFSHWGKSSRSSDQKTMISTVQNKFESLDNGWFKASCNITVPDNVSMLRSFELTNVRGTWKSIEIRKHRVRLLSDSITEAKYIDGATLATLAGQYANLPAQLQQLAQKEQEEASLLIEKKSLETRIALLEAQEKLSSTEKQQTIAAKQAEVNRQRNFVQTLQQEEQNYKSIYDSELNNPLNYYCYILGKGFEDSHRLCVVNNYDQGMNVACFPNSHGNTKTCGLFKFSLVEGGYYQIINQYYENSHRICVVNPLDQGMNVACFPNSHGNTKDGSGKFKISSLGNGYYHIIPQAYETTHRLCVVLPYDKGMDVACFPNWHNNTVGGFKLVRSDQQSNQKITNARNLYEATSARLKIAVATLQKLEEELRLLQSVSTDNSEKIKLQQRLAEVVEQLKQVQKMINTLNNEILKVLCTTQQTPQAMPQVAKDGKGLVTQGALLGFVQSASRLNAIETCEGNVQLSYLDSEGRMRQTNYDATADGKNTAFEQWIPDAQRACLNFSNSDSVVKLNQPFYLPTDWSIEAWFFYPLPETGEWNTLIRGKDVDHHILVRNRQQLGIYLTNDSLGQNFYDSGFNMELLTRGWHHLAAVGRRDTTLFYVDGKKVGDVKAKALKIAEENLNKNPNDAAAKKKAEDIKKASLKSNSHVYAIANNHLSISQSADDSVMNFDGVNDRISVVDNPNLQITTYTVEVWIKPNGISNEEWKGIVGKSKRNFNIWLHNSGCIHQRFHTSSSVSAGPPDTPSGTITWNQWNHIAITNDGTTAKTYINGELKAEGPTDGSLVVDKTPLYMGCGLDSGAGNYFNGQLADVRIWKVARTQAEIKANMSQRLSGKETNLVAYYPLNKLEGDKVLDLVGNNHGTVVEANTVKDQSLSITPFIQSEQFGKLAEVRVWGVALSDDEIAVNSKILLSGNESGLLAYYPMSEATGVEIRDHSGNGYSGTMSGANWWGCTAPIGYVDKQNIPDALVSNEYSTVSIENNCKVATMRRFFAYPTTNSATLFQDKRIETLEMKWIGNAQFAPTLLGYIEGAPPVPSENLTVSDDYNGATSVELTMSEDVEFSWNRSQDTGLGANREAFIGAETESDAGLGFTTKVATMRAGFKGNLEFSYQFQNESNITSSSSLSMTDKLELRGMQEETAKFPHLGKRFVPKNIGYALVISALADVFVTRLSRSKRMIGYQVQPVEGIPPDVNTITFLMNPAYTMNGSLDGLTGSQPTTERFFRHVPEMRAQYGALYPASYYRLQEAYALKEAIEAEDKRRESYFAGFNVHLVDEASLDRNIDSGAAPTTIGVQREEDKPSTTMTEAEKKKADEEKLKNIKADANAKVETQSAASKAKQSEIQSKIADQEKRVQATDSFAGWQKRMEALQIRAGKRNIVNTYVWDADGGLRTEAQSFANTVEHTIGGSFTMNAALGAEAKFGAMATAELTAQATVNLTQTMSKTEARSKGFELSVDLSGVEFRGVTDFKDNPILPGEKVDRYRFMSFYLDGSTQNFQDFFNYVVDPEWLASNDEEARALRQTQAGKPNKTWRVLHRVTYVERPALMGFGRDARTLRAAAETSEQQQLLDKIASLETNNKKLEEKLDKILAALTPKS